ASWPQAKLLRIEVNLPLFPGAAEAGDDQPSKTLVTWRAEQAVEHGHVIKPAGRNRRGLDACKAARSLKGGDVAFVCKRQANVVQAVQQAITPKRLDLERPRQAMRVGEPA